jgi:hypothetical protein
MYPYQQWVYPITVTDSRAFAFLAQQGYHSNNSDKHHYIPPRLKKCLTHAIRHNQTLLAISSYQIKPHNLHTLARQSQLVIKGWAQGHRDVCMATVSLQSEYLQMTYKQGRGLHLPNLTVICPSHQAKLRCSDHNNI